MYFPKNYFKENEPILKDLFLYLINQKINKRENLNKFIKKYLKDKKLKNNYLPKLWQLRFIYHRYFSNLKIDKKFLELLKVVSIRSLSGIVPLSVFTSPKNSCPFNCLYCSLNDNAPKSYFPDEAAVMRAIRGKYQPFWQTFDRLAQFYLSGHPIDKVEVIIQGGTFSFYEKKYRRWFVKKILDGLNTDVENIIKTGQESYFNSKNLNQAIKKNQIAKSRMVGLTIETRPDFINEEEILFLRNLGVTRVEIGVQTIDNKILKLVNRGHTVEAIIKATKLLREAGFKITYHLMPGLPGTNFEKDVWVLKEVFKNNNFKPDNLKFYPTQLVKNSPLVEWYYQGKFKPIDENYLIRLTEIFKKEIVPHWVRINRLVRDLTRNDLVIENFPSNFRQEIKEYLKRKDIHCPCIRCREIFDQKIAYPTNIKITQYQANNGEEFFIEIIDKKNKLLGYLRLRIPEFVLKKKNFFIKSLLGCSIIREIHILGQLVPFSKKEAVQHHGLGRQLIEKAIEISQKFNLKKIAVISAIGTRGYYQRLGFSLTDYGYMVKNI